MSGSVFSHNGTIIEFHAQNDLVFILISTASITGNTLILLATWRERCLHQPNKYFIACLAVADLLVGIFIGPVRAYGQSVGHGSLRNIHLCRFILWIDNLVFSASICSLSFISFDRYLKISKPLHYRSRMTTSKSLKIIFIIWLIPQLHSPHTPSLLTRATRVLKVFAICMMIKADVTQSIRVP